MKWQQLKGVAEYLEMKTRMRMQPKDWHTGFQLYSKPDGTVAYIFLPRVNCSK